MQWNENERNEIENTCNKKRNQPQKNRVSSMQFATRWMAVFAVLQKQIEFCKKKIIHEMIRYDTFRAKNVVVIIRDQVRQESILQFSIRIVDVDHQSHKKVIHCTCNNNLQCCYDD